MLLSEREKLYNWESDYLSIGISESGEPYGKYPIPWDLTSSAFNMKLPRVFITPDDLSDKEIMSKILEFRVTGCYIFCSLESYDFLKAFKFMRDLNIYNAHNLRDLSFLEYFEDCRMLFLSKAHLNNINEVAGAGNHFFARPNRVALYDCMIDDISYLKENNCFFLELVVCNPAHRCERARWKGLRRVKYYEYTGEDK